MKQILLPVLLGAALLTGCARHYVITLNNGSRITTNGKPHLKEGSYVYRDTAGRTVGVPAGSVQDIAPASMVRGRKDPYNPRTVQ